MLYTFDQIFAADPDNPEMVASGGMVLLFTPGDESKTPLAITDATGVPLPNPVPVNEKGFGPAFMSDLDRVAWEAGGLTGFFTSYEGIRDVAVLAEARAAVAATAATNSEAAATTAAASAVSEVQESLSGALSAVQQAAADAAAAAQLVAAPAGDVVRVAVSPGGAAFEAVSAAIDQAMPTVSPERYGAVGDGVADDTAALRAMLSSPTRAFSPDPNKRYRITGQLDFGRSSDWVTPLNILLTGPRNGTGATLWVQNKEVEEQRTALFVQGKHSGVKIDVRVETHPTKPWLAIIGNDYHLHADGSRPSYATDFSFGEVKVVATGYSTGYTGDTNGCLRFQGMDRVQIAHLTVKGFRNVCKINDVPDVGMGTDTAHIEEFSSGIQITRSLTATIGSLYAQAIKTGKEFNESGCNALVMRGVADLMVGDAQVYDTGGHGMRLTSWAAGTGVGLDAMAITTNASFGHVRVYRPGGSGFKAASSGAADNEQADIGNVRFASLYVEDTGQGDYNTGGTFTGNNHFGLNLQSVASFTCPSFITKRVNSLHNGRYCAMLRNVSNLYIGTFQGSGSYDSALFWSGGGDASQIHSNVIIGSGIAADYGRGGRGFALNLYNSNKVGRVSINLDAHNGPGLIEFSGEAGAPHSFWKINTTYNNVADPSIIGGSEVRQRITAKSAAGPTTSGEINYSIEDILFCSAEQGATGTLRNVEADVYLMSSDSVSFVAVRAGTTPTTAVGAKLPGKWRSRGRVGTNALVQRVG